MTTKSGNLVDVSTIREIVSLAKDITARATSNESKRRESDVREFT
jgi:hypothetical protein